MKKINPSLETFEFGKFRTGYRHITDEHSQTLAALGYRPEFDANKLADFVSRYASGTTHDGEVQPLSESRVSPAHEPMEEDDLELTYSDSLVSA